MSRVATQARKLSSAFQETSALTQICRLKANVPGAVPFECGAFRDRKAMTLPTRIIQLRRGKVARIPEGNLAAGPLVFASGPMASFTADSIFMRADITAADLHRTRGVARETFRDVQSLMLHSSRIREISRRGRLLTRRDSQLAGLGIE